VVGMTNKARRRQGAASNLLGSTAPIAENGIVDQAAGAPPVVADPPIPASEVVPAPPAGTEPDNAAVLLDPTLTGEPGAPQPIVSAAPVLAMEPSAVDVVQREAKAERIAADQEPGATGDPALDAVAAQPTIAIEGETGATAAVGDALRSAVSGGVMDGISETALSTLGTQSAGFSLASRITGQGALATTRRASPDEVIAALDDLAKSDPTSLERIRQQFFSASTVDSPAALTLPDTVTVIAVSGPPGGRRRAGMSFGTQPRLFRASDLSKAAVAALRSDPALAVSVNDMAAADAQAIAFEPVPTAFA
jgi:hypothetical protein